jgi:hypothetical protein
MRRSISLIKWLPAAIVMLTLTASRAEAVTLQEIMDLTRAGVSDEVLLALIEIDQRVFPIDPATLRKLKDAGVSERVMVAIVKSGRTPSPALAAEPPATPAPNPNPPDPQVVVIEREPVVREVVVPVPVYIAVGSLSHARHSRQVRYPTSSRPFAPFAPFPTVLDPPPPSVVTPVHPHKTAAPVYWGWGGKLRPDAWSPTPR